MTEVMTTGVEACSALTNPAEMAANENCKEPIKAEALPAFFPWSARAAAVVLGKSIPIVPI